MAAEFDMDAEIDTELETDMDAELEKLYAEMDELLFDQKGYDKLPNSLAELEKLKAALPEKQRAESQLIEQAHADLEKEVETFKTCVSMPENPEDLEKIYGRRTKVGRILIICVIPLFLLGPLTQNVTFWFFALLALLAGIIMRISGDGGASEETKADYQLACTDFEAYKEKKAKEFAEKKESTLYEREFKLGHERRLIDRKIAAVKAEIDYRAKHKPKCPTCGSDRVAPIGEVERYMDSTGFGTLVGGGLNSPSLGKSYRCFNCDYRW